MPILILNSFPKKIIVINDKFPQKLSSKSRSFSGNLYVYLWNRFLKINYTQVGIVVLFTSHKQGNNLVFSGFSSAVPAQFIPGRTGAGLLILNGFTFYMKNHQAHGKKQWYCSSRDVHGCRADVITYKGVDGRDYISIFRGRHIHYPPRLRQCHDGRFIREKDFRIPIKFEKS